MSVPDLRDAYHTLRLVSDSQEIFWDYNMVTKVKLKFLNVYYICLLYMGQLF